MTALVLLGGGGHCRSCIDVIEEQGAYRILGILDRADRVGEELDGYRIVGGDGEIPRLAAEGAAFLVTVGQLESAETRVRLFRLAKEAGAPLATIISPHARLARRAVVGEGTIVMHHAVVNAGARIGGNCILNTGSLVEHDASIGDHCHVSTGAIVNGCCTVGRRVFVGSNAVLRNGISVCDDVVLGAGSVATRDITVPGTWFGNPAARRS